MKQKLLFSILAGAMIFCGCEKKGGDDTMDRLTGLWVPYELTVNDGTVLPGPFTFSSIFGAYAESVQFKEDRSYVPVQFENASTKHFRTTEEGTYQYLTSGRKLVLNGISEIEARVERLTDNEMWLTMSQTGNLYKFRKAVY